jgi:predicted amidohydrolase
MAVRIGMGQMRVVGGEPETNLGRASRFIADAAGQNCDIVVLPECLDLGWTHPSARSLARPIPGDYCDRLADAARAAGIHVVAGLTEQAAPVVYNAAVLLSPQGEILHRHRKINVLDIAQDLYAIGEGLSVARTALGTIGVNICADNFRSSLALGHSLGRMGAQLLLSPCAWAVPGDHDPTRDPYCIEWKSSYPLLARLYDMTVVGVSNVGPIEAGVWAGRKCIGNSLAVGPGGDILVEAPYGQDAETLITVDAEIMGQPQRGTLIAEELKRRGYDGP